LSTVTIAGKQVRLDPKWVIGKGGEADVYLLPSGEVLKLYKLPTDTDYQGNLNAQQGARERIATHQAKLPAFPKGLPSSVVGPTDLAYDRAGKIAGFTMRYLAGQEVLLSLGDRKYRESGGLGGDFVAAAFGNLHEVVRAVHSAGIVIGDFNDLNVLFAPADGSVCLVDADSMQYGVFHCKTFTARLVDPLCCAPDQLTLIRPHNEGSDWYAYASMLLQSLLYVGPYGGVHKPAGGGKKLQHDARVLQRIWLLDPSVTYPKPALPYSILPDDLMQVFANVYTQDVRSEFPLSVVQGLRWTNCTNCGRTHARARCPQCAAPGRVKETVTKRGKVTANRVFLTKGRIVQAVVQNGILRYLYHEDDAFRREGDRFVAESALDPELRFRIRGEMTLLGKGERVAVLAPNQQPALLITATVGRLPVFDTNANNRFWIDNGHLVRDGHFDISEQLGSVLQGRTLLWAGNSFGFGFYQAGSLVRAFVFSTISNSLNDSVAIGPLPGQLLDASCTFSDNRAWFMVRLQQQGRTITECFVIKQSGEVIATAKADEGDNSWLAQGIRGHFASGSGALFAATDDGIVKVVCDNGTIRVAQSFPDTEPFVDANTQLMAGPGGIYAVSDNSITLLQMG
jgi:hypothetical protein